MTVVTGAPVVEIQDGGDDVINPSDVDENGKVDAKVTFPKDAGYSSDQRSRRH
ncbi:hypothetical protein ACT4W8_01540 [Acinetobacter baumannii]